MKLLNSKKAGGPAAVPLIGGMALVLLILGLVVLLPFIFGSGLLTVKIYQLLFLTKVGQFPMWALWVVTILGFVILRKLRGTRYQP